MLQVGAHAPAFTLRDVDGQIITLDTPVAPLTLAVFFKTTCPTCHYAWKYYERLHTAYYAAGLRTLGISQQDAGRTRDYRDEHHATFPHLVDEGFTVSRAYDPEFVPTGFLVDERGEIIEILAAWQSEGMNKLASKIATHLGEAAQAIVRPEDGAVAFKAG